LITLELCYYIKTHS